MQQETLHATKRVTSGSRASRRLRSDGRVPGVVYGTGLDPTAVHVSSRDLYAVLHTEAGLTRLIASTYQAVSGAGRSAIEEMVRQDSEPWATTL